MADICRGSLDGGSNKIFWKLRRDKMDCELEKVVSSIIDFEPSLAVATVAGWEAAISVL